MKSSIRYILQSSINSIQILANSSTIFDIISLLSRIIYNSSGLYLSISSGDISASGNSVFYVDILRCKFPIDFCISDNLIILRPYDQVTIFHMKSSIYFGIIYFRFKSIKILLTGLGG